VPGRPERHLLTRLAGIRVAVVVGGEERVDIDEIRRLGGRTGTGIGGHRAALLDLDGRVDPTLPAEPP
jgi:hypothetical protein